MEELWRAKATEAYGCSSYSFEITPDGWVYGILIDENTIAGELIEITDAHVVFEQWTDIDKKTIGKYIGIKDRDKEKIFDGDILEIEDLAEVGYEYPEEEEFINWGVVKIRNCRVEIDVVDHNSYLLECLQDDYEEFIEMIKKSKVRGNIYDNPDILKEL